MSGRSCFLVGLLLLIGGLWACWCGVAMTWDGPYQFALSLVQQRPYSYLSRFHSYLLWLPTVLASRETQDFNTLQMIYGLPYCLAPFAGFALSWCVARKHAPGLLVWAVFGIAIAPLPGQIFMINDSIFQQHLFWPLLLGALCPLNAWQRVALALISVFQLSHPIGIGLCGGAAAVAAHSAWRDPAHRSQFLASAAWLALLSAGGIVKLFVFPDSYAAQEASIVKLVILFWQGVAGWPLLALIFFGWAAWIVQRSTAESDSRRLRRALMLSAIGAMVLLYWASDPHRWVKALDYRRWLVPLTLPFFVLAFLERNRASAPLSMALAAARGRLAVALAAIFVAVLGLQSAGWKSLVDRLAAQVLAHPGPIISAADLEWSRNTAMDHWGTTALVIVLQGREPHTIRMDASDYALLAHRPPFVPLVAHHPISLEPGSAGWYDFRPVVANIRSGVGKERLTSMRSF